MSDSIFGRMLERFEAEHGGYYELLAQYPAKTEAETKRLERLMRHHDKLVWAWMGFSKGYEAGLKAAKEQQ
jgi:hypothetical protein